MSTQRETSKIGLAYLTVLATGLLFCCACLAAAAYRNWKGAWASYVLRQAADLGGEIAAALTVSLAFLSAGILIAGKRNPERIADVVERLWDGIEQVFGIIEDESTVTVRQRPLRRRLRGQRKIKLFFDGKLVPPEDVKKLWCMVDLSSGFYYRHPTYGEGTDPMIPAVPIGGVLSPRIVVITDHVDDQGVTKGKSESISAIVAAIIDRNASLLQDAESTNAPELLNQFVDIVYEYRGKSIAPERYYGPDDLHLKLANTLQHLKDVGQKRSVAALDCFHDWTEHEFRRLLLLLLTDDAIESLAPTVFLVASKELVDSAIRDMASRRLLSASRQHDKVSRLDETSSSGQTRWQFEVLAPYRGGFDFAVHKQHLETPQSQLARVSRAIWMQNHGEHAQ